MDLIKTRTLIDSASTISHEIKTPVNLIASTAMVIRKLFETGNPPSEEALCKYMDNILNNCNRITALTENVMDLVVPSSPSPMLYELIAPPEFVEKFCQELKPYVDQQQLHFTYKVAATCPSIQVIVQWLERILLNLIINSIKYNDKKTKKTQLHVFEEGEFVVFSVKDNGNGISKHDLNRVTEKFYRVPGAQTNGLGLGLALVDQFTRGMNGKLTIKSELENGTEVLVALPKSQNVLRFRSDNPEYLPNKSVFSGEFALLSLNIPK